VSKVETKDEKQALLEAIRRWLQSQKEQQKFVEFKPKNTGDIWDR